MFKQLIVGSIFTLALVQTTVADPKKGGAVGKAPPKPVGKALPKPVGKAPPKPVGKALPKPVGKALPKPVGKAPPKPVGKAPPKPVGKALPKPVGKANPISNQANSIVSKIMKNGQFPGLNNKKAPLIIRRNGYVYRRVRKIRGRGGKKGPGGKGPAGKPKAAKGKGKK